MSRRPPTSPDVTLSMNCGAVFRRSLRTGNFIQTRQLAPERFTNQQPWDYAPPPPVPPPSPAQAAAAEVLDLEL